MKIVGYLIPPSHGCGIAYIQIELTWEHQLIKIVMVNNSDGHLLLTALIKIATNTGKCQPAYIIIFNNSGAYIKKFLWMFALKPQMTYNNDQKPATDQACIKSCLKLTSQKFLMV